MNPAYRCFTGRHVAVPIELYGKGEFIPDGDGLVSSVVGQGIGAACIRRFSGRKAGALIEQLYALLAVRTNGICGRSLPGCGRSDCDRKRISVGEVSFFRCCRQGAAALRDGAVSRGGGAGQLVISMMRTAQCDIAGGDGLVAHVFAVIGKGRRGGHVVLSHNAAQGNTQILRGIGRAVVDLSGGARNGGGQRLGQ